MEKLKRIKNGLIKYFKMIIKFAVNDLKKRYSGSLLGFIWAYVQPLVVILVWWFVFEVGIKNAPVGNYPFIVFLVPAYVGWTYISDSIMQSSNSLYEYSYLVKKIKFKIEILPLVKVASTFFIHLFFVVFAMAIYWIYGFTPSWSWLQLIYYCFAATVLLAGTSWLVSSLSVFWKDIVQLINVLLQVGFWLTPVFWNPDTMDKGSMVLKVLKCNPAYYIVAGYRESLMGVNSEGEQILFFTTHLQQTILFWSITLIVFCLGLLCFKKLSKHYADLL